MENGIYKNTKLSNKNIPNTTGIKIWGSIVSGSGEIITTYYELGYNWFKVSDWKYDVPTRLTSEQYTQETEPVFNGLTIIK